MHILITDDSISIRKFLKSILEKEKYIVTEAESGEEALKLFLVDTFDLITLDIEMPGISGYETCQRIREIEKLNTKGFNTFTPVLFITANDSVSGRIKGFEAGTTDFITKTFTKEFLIETVKNIFEPRNALAGIRVLLVEDSFVSRIMIKNILIEQGSVVIEAEDGKIAMEIIKNNPQLIDIVLTDYFMPKMNGDELCDTIQNKIGLKNIPFIFITGINEEENILKVFKVGGVDYIVKPFVKEELIARLKVHAENLLLNRSNERQMQELKNTNVIKDNLLAICSHDLKSPLTGILGFSELLLMDESLNKEQIEQLEYIRTSGFFLLSLINDLLDAATYEFETEIEMSVVSLNQIVKQSIFSLKTIALQKKIHLFYEELDSNPFKILGNFNAMLRAINNLVSNAIKFTKENGEIKVKLGFSDESNFFVSIEDNGIGIQSDKIDSIFNKFSRASRVGTSGEKGTGLGLSITKNLIEKHGGEIKVQSQEGMGTKFTIFLPIVKSENHSLV